MWVPDISKIYGPRYLAVASAIAEAIDSGELPPGTQLPPQRDLADQLGVTVGTIGRAYAVAKRRMLVTGEVGRGTFVRENHESPGTFNYLPERKPGTIDFACYRSPVEGLSEAIASAVAEVAERAVLLPMHKYPPASGFLTHRTTGAAWIRRVGLEVPPERVLVCGGAQQAMVLALTTLAKAGDHILTEQLTYSGVKSIAALNNLVLDGVAMDEGGIDPDALDAACEETGAKIVYLQPTLHNPTLALMPESRRRRIADIARRRGLIIIEDDAAVSGYTERPLPIGHYAPERTVYITSISKCVSPAFRVGFMAVPASLWERMNNTLHALTLAAPPLMVEVATMMIVDGRAEAIVGENMAQLKRRNEKLLKLLDGFEVRSHPAAFFCWLHLPEPWTSVAFAEATKRHGVSVVPADNFAVGRTQPPAAVRISVNPASKPEVLTKGLQTLVKVLQERPQPQLAVV